jgi:hypothetical protein
MKQTMKQTMKLLGVLAFFALTSSSAKAYTYAFQDSGIINFGATTATTNTEFAIGYFTGSIQTTDSEISLLNFVNLNSGGAWSMPIDLFENGAQGAQFITVGTDPMDANTGGLKPAVGTKLYLVGRSVSDAPAGQGPFSFALGNSAWSVQANGPSDTGGFSYAWGEGFGFVNATVLTPNISSLVTNGGGAYVLTVSNLAAIPEPSVASLLALGTVGLVALRVRRKS